MTWGELLLSLRAQGFANLMSCKFYEYGLIEPAILEGFVRKCSNLLNWLKVFLGLYHHLLLSKGLKLKSTRFFKMWKKRDYWFKCGCKLCFVWALLENIPHCYQLLGCDWFNLGLWKISGNVLNLSKFGFWPRISGTCKNAGNYRCYYRSWNSQKYIKIERNF